MALFCGGLGRAVERLRGCFLRTVVRLGATSARIGFLGSLWIGNASSA